VIRTVHARLRAVRDCCQFIAWRLRVRHKPTRGWPGRNSVPADARGASSPEDDQDRRAHLGRGPRHFEAHIVVRLTFVSVQNETADCVARVSRSTLALSVRPDEEPIGIERAVKSTTERSHVPRRAFRGARLINSSSFSRAMAYGATSLTRCSRWSSATSQSTWASRTSPMTPR